MIKILIADDDPHIRAIIREYAQAEDWTFEEADNGEQALESIDAKTFNLIVLDVMMPKVDGWSVMKRLRAQSDVPVIMLTARHEEYDKLLGFELGVDDYMGKPFSPRELIARIKALLKRSGATDENTRKREFNNLVIDIGAHKVTLDGKQLSLTPKEFDLLEFLSARPGTVFTRNQILNYVWGYDYYGDARTVDTHVRTLREKLGRCNTLIATVWGTGYRFDIGEKNEAH